MTDIRNRADINVLVNTFYTEIRKDDLLGPIFNGAIADHQWEEHLTKLTDFWETNLFGIVKFKGNPTQKHINLDKKMNFNIAQGHFGQWLLIWFSVIDTLFVGELADKAKNSARKMSTGQFLAIWTNRPKDKLNI